MNSVSYPCPMPFNVIPANSFSVFNIPGFIVKVCICFTLSVFFISFMNCGVTSMGILVSSSEEEVSIITTCEPNPITFELISFLNPKAMATAKSITASPTATPVIAIFMAGSDALLVLFSAE